MSKPGTNFMRNVFLGAVAIFICLLAWDLMHPKKAHAQEGFATYYTQASTKADGNSGVLTASGKRYDEDAMTCAMRRRDWGSEFLVHGHNTNKTVVVKLTDFGPGRGPTRKGVVIDLTPTAFKEVCGDLKQGKCQVSVQEVL